jgi:hypothetical protein
MKGHFAMKDCIPTPTRSTAELDKITTPDSTVPAPIGPPGWFGRLVVKFEGWFGRVRIEGVFERRR